MVITPLSGILLMSKVRPSRNFKIVSIHPFHLIRSPIYTFDQIYSPTGTYENIIQTLNED